jgi:hypothetical protein
MGWIFFISNASVIMQARATADIVEEIQREKGAREIGSMVTVPWRDIVF